MVPPLAVCGIGLALGRKATADVGLSLSERGLFSGRSDIASDAIFLFLANFSGIVVVAGAVLRSQGYWRIQLETTIPKSRRGAFLNPPAGMRAGG